MHKRAVSCLSVFLSVRLSVTFVYSVKIRKHIFELFSPSGRPAILVFLYQKLTTYFLKWKQIFFLKFHLVVNVHHRTLVNILSARFVASLFQGLCSIMDLGSIKRWRNNGFRNVYEWVIQWRHALSRERIKATRRCSLLPSLLSCPHFAAVISPLEAGMQMSCSRNPADTVITLGWPRGQSACLWRTRWLKVLTGT